jgi:hypothetical protein
MNRWPRRLLSAQLVDRTAIRATRQHSEGAPTVTMAVSRVTENVAELSRECSAKSWHLLHGRLSD